MIHINRDRQNLGQFSPEEVAEGLRSHRFLPEDLAWREGMDGWQPLSTFTDLPAPEETMAPAPDEREMPLMDPTELTPAWEQEKPLMTRVLETVQTVMLAPVKAFANVGEESNYLKPLSFFVLVGWPATVISIVYQAILESINPKSNPQAAALGPGVMVAIYAGLAVLMPLFLTIGAFVGAGIYHLMLKMLGAATRPFAATFRIVCYANGATSILVVIPFCGSFVQPFWNLYAVIIGLRETHRTTTMNAVIAVLVPIILCCGALFAGVALIAGLAAAGTGAKP